MTDLAPEATPDPTVVAAIKEQVKKPLSKNKAKVKPLAKMEAKNKSTKK